MDEILITETCRDKNAIIYNINKIFIIKTVFLNFFQILLTLLVNSNINYYC